ncbi:hypothetical protein UFOVP247_104 [uncultured Caudovirales phage]|uniref:Uncharacterized protein n=1 Tax=uncultured Caudovirales phage TaxID=2100421 RepID=A0A6J7X1N2_9CAUD|nr:hypothetical protein UFOVP247_104 [uncultured Caudovirales phage]
MTAILLKSFANKITTNILDEFFKNLYTFDFDASANVTNSSYFFTVTNSGNNTVYNGDTVLYYTNVGGNVLTGLGNSGLYTVTSANSTGFKLANVSTGATVTVVSSAASETHHFAVQNHAYYFAASKHSPWEDENNPDTPADNLKSVYEFQREMMFGKRIDRADLAFMIRKIDWTSGVVYDYYDDTDQNLFDKDFYVLTNNSRVYKCLDNNNGSLSTVKPTGTLTTPYTTGDGYTWKYMYTLSTANNSKFSTSQFIPVDVNTSITAAAANGSIEFIQIDTAGVGYTGFATGYIQEVVSNTVFKIETSTTAVSNDYYNTSGFYISAGTGAGQLVNVLQYVVNALGHYVQTDASINTPVPDLTSQYLISPQIKFTGDGTGLKAYCNVNTSGNVYSIGAINILNRGSGYSYCVANVVANPAYGNSAILRPVLSPLGGHGYDQTTELGAAYLCISSNFSNTESGVISTKVQFRKAGIVHDPRPYVNASLSYTNTAFSGLYTMQCTVSSAPLLFSEGETIIGGTSNAHGIVAWSNSSFLELSMKHGTFTSSEVVNGSNSGAQGIVVSINTPDINKFTNEVLYYDYFEPIQRSNTTTETVKLLIAI